MKKTQIRKSMVLIVVIFLMLIFAVLGTTLLDMQSGDFELSLSTLDSERALSLAESGGEWALKKLSGDITWRTTGAPSDNLPHSLAYGEYNVVCYDHPTEADKIVISSIGFIPSQSDCEITTTNCRAKRQTELTVALGTLGKPIQITHLFDWSPTAGHYINIDGDIGVIDKPDDLTDGYEGNGVLPHSEAADLAVPGSGEREIMPEGLYPQIDMDYFESHASNIWSPPRTAKITNITHAAGKSTLTLDTSIFSNPTGQWNDEVIRNISKGNSWSAIQNVLANDRVRLAAQVDWVIGERISIIPFVSNVVCVPANHTCDITVSCKIFTNPFPGWYKGAILKNLTSGGWNYQEWGIIKKISNGPGNSQVIRIELDNSVDLTNPLNRWSAGDRVGIARRFYANMVWKGIRYVTGDAFIDLRIKNSLLFQRTYIIAEGDIGLRGDKAISTTPGLHGSRYPSLATKQGDIFCPDTPSGGSDSSKRLKHKFGGIIYSEKGDIDFNYLTALAVLGVDVTLRGSIKLDNPRFVNQPSTQGFEFSSSTITWQEE